MAETKRCPYCAEEIQAEATRCRYCRSRLATFDVAGWHRSHAEGRLAGVCAALAHALAIPTAAVRLVFVVLTFFHLLGPLLYAGLWLIIPRTPDGESQLEHLLRWGLRAAGVLGGRRTTPRLPPAPPASPTPPAVPDRV